MTHKRKPAAGRAPGGRQNAKHNQRPDSSPPLGHGASPAMTEPSVIFVAPGKCFLCGKYMSNPLVGTFVGNHPTKANSLRVGGYRTCHACAMHMANGTKRGRRYKRMVERAWREGWGVQICL